MFGRISSFREHWHRDLFESFSFSCWPLALFVSWPYSQSLFRFYSSIYMTPIRLHLWISSHCDSFSLWSCSPPWLGLPPTCMLTFHCITLFADHLIALLLYVLTTDERMKGREMVIENGYPSERFLLLFSTCPELTQFVLPSARANLPSLAWFLLSPLYGRKTHCSFTFFAL